MDVYDEVDRRETESSKQDLSNTCHMPVLNMQCTAWEVNWKNVPYLLVYELLFFQVLKPGNIVICSRQCFGGMWLSKVKLPLWPPQRHMGTWNCRWTHS